MVNTLQDPSRVDAVPTHDLNALVTNIKPYGQMLEQRQVVTHNRFLQLLADPEANQDELSGYATEVNAMFPSGISDID